MKIVCIFTSTLFKNQPKIRSSHTVLRAVCPVAQPQTNHSSCPLTGMSSPILQCTRLAGVVQTALLLLEVLPSHFRPQSTLLSLPFILITGQLSLDVPVFLFKLLHMCCSQLTASRKTEVWMEQKEMLRETACKPLLQDQERALPNTNKAASRARKGNGFILLTAKMEFYGNSHLFFGFQEPRGHFPDLLSALPEEGQSLRRQI